MMGGRRGRLCLGSLVERESGDKKGSTESRTLPFLLVMYAETGFPSSSDSPVIKRCCDSLEKNFFLNTFSLCYRHVWKDAADIISGIIFFIQLVIKYLTLLQVVP